MRFMCWHVDYVKAEPKGAGRSGVIEQGASVEAGESLLIFANFEKKDESSKQNTVDAATFEIQKIAAVSSEPDHETLMRILEEQEFISQKTAIYHIHLMAL